MVAFFRVPRSANEVVGLKDKSACLYSELSTARYLSELERCVVMDQDDLYSHNLLLATDSYKVSSRESKTVSVCVYGGMSSRDLATHRARLLVQ